MQLMFQPLVKYVDFEGRARRAEFWLFLLFNFMVSAICSLIAGSDSLLVTIIWLALLVPSVAVGVRRLHDIGMSGWWYLINIIPFVGFIFLLVIGLMPGDRATNRFGAPPSNIAGTREV